MDTNELLFLSEVYEWDFISHDEKRFEMLFKRSGVKLLVNYSTMKVTTFLNHPRQGATALQRKLVTNDLLEDIMFNPRVHSTAGQIVRRHEERLAWRKQNIAKRRGSDGLVKKRTKRRI